MVSPSAEGVLGGVTGAILFKRQKKEITKSCLRAVNNGFTSPAAAQSLAIEM
jgi:hypothetical protein